MAKQIKKRNWAFVAYPDSLPTDWLDRLQATGLPFAVSPLHEFDVDPTGETKKPHYHVIVCYPGPTTLSVVQALTSDLGQPNPTALESVQGYYRYFTHKDNPDKYQYDERKIRTFGGFDITSWDDLTAKEVLEIKEKIVGIIRDLRINEYATLIEYLIDNGYYQEWSVASNHTIFFERYISSRRHRHYNDSKRRFREYWANIDDTKMVEEFYSDIWSSQLDV